MNPDSVFFVADTHFGHERVLEHDRRPFDSIQEHDETIIQQWNETVRPGDTVFHLGDFAFRNQTPVEEYRRRLHGRIHLIEGNHDRHTKEDLAKIFESYQPFALIKLFKRRITLCHYSMRTWYRMWDGHWHLHGHSHGQLPRLPGSLDVGINNIGYRPISFARIDRFMNSFTGAPHHKEVRFG